MRVYWGKSILLIILLSFRSREIKQKQNKTKQTNKYRSVPVWLTLNIKSYLDLDSARQNLSFASKSFEKVRR